MVTVLSDVINFGLHISPYISVWFESGGDIIQRKCVPGKVKRDEICNDATKDRLAAVIKTKTGKDVNVSCDNGCDTDGCNSASQYGPVAMMVAVPAIILRIASLF